MRRTDREITDPAVIDTVITACDTLRLAIPAEGAPYLVPLSFGFAHADGVRTFYMHCASEGRKLTLLRRHPRVGFELDTAHAVSAGRDDQPACVWGFLYQSVLGTGTVDFVTDETEKRAALESLMRHYAGRGGWTFEPKMLSAVTVLRLTVEELSAKQRV